MKEWIRPELEQLEISETRFGGNKSELHDAAWVDENTGEWQFGYVS